MPTTTRLSLLYSSWLVSFRLLFAFSLSVGLVSDLPEISNNQVLLSVYYIGVGVGGKGNSIRQNSGASLFVSQ